MHGTQKRTGVNGMYIPLTKEFLERQELYETYLVDGHLENAPPEAEEAFKKNMNWLNSQFND